MFDLAAIEALAPDQASLKAAAKLRAPAGWPATARRGSLYWGERLGSGANPYQVVVDAADQGYRCSCPSRKFPCKHALAPMLLAAERPDLFAETEPPAWVADWLGRRRRNTTGAAAGATTEAATDGAGKSLDAALTAEETASEIDAKAEARRAAAAQNRAAATDRALRDGLGELEQWIADQLRLGLDGFLGEASARCRRIAARLVDAKAQTLAARLDDLPGWLAALPPPERAEAAIAELSRLVLLIRSWRAAPDNPSLRREIATAESRDAVLAHPDAPRAAGIWEVVAAETRARRDGLTAQATWLLRIGAPEPCFALLLDYVAGAGRGRPPAFAPGERIEAELAFFPSPWPLRAVIAARGDGDCDAADEWPAAPDAETALTGALDPLWRREAPVLLPAGRLGTAGGDSGGISVWWRSAQGELALPADSAPDDVAFGAPLDALAGVWDGARLRLLAAQGPLGRIDLTPRDGVRRRHG